MSDYLKVWKVLKSGAPYAPKVHAKNAGIKVSEYFMLWYNGNWNRLHPLKTVDL